MKVIRNSLISSIETNARSIPSARKLMQSPSGKWIAETEAHTHGTSIHLIKATNSATRVTEISLIKENITDPHDHVAFDQTGKDAAGMREPALEKNFVGSLHELSLLDLGRIALAVRRATVTIQDAEFFEQ